MHPYATVVLPIRKMLVNLDRWLDIAVEFAEKKKFPVENLLQSRLAPDQYPLVAQVRVACDNAKGAVTRLANKPVPSHPDTETTVPELKARIAKVLELIDGFRAEDFAGYAELKISLPWMGGKWITGEEYCQFVVANFYFHTVTAYSIFRSNGVDLGKMDFIGGLDMRD